MGASCIKAVDLVVEVHDEDFQISCVELFHSSYWDHVQAADFGLRHIVCDAPKRLRVV